MAALPAPVAVIRPLLTVATRESLVLQIKLWPAGDVEADIVSTSPTYIEGRLVFEREMPEVLTSTLQDAL